MGSLAVSYTTNKIPPKSTYDNTFFQAQIKDGRHHIGP